jgi:hypothetical protein|tara:strand:- start:15860 stop:16048 length:189 start_codon:yes stop_codon:yes gene_type:complete
MPSEISITVKNDEKRQTTKHLIYDVYAVHEEDPLIKDLMDRAVKEFNDTPDKVSVKITMEVK